MGFLYFLKVLNIWVLVSKLSFDINFDITVAAKNSIIQFGGIVSMTISFYKLLTFLNIFLPIQYLMMMIKMMMIMMIIMNCFVENLTNEGALKRSSIRNHYLYSYYRRPLKHCTKYFNLPRTKSTVF